MAAPPFVDVHTHVVPSGDDGARTVAEGLELCALAARTGTAIVFATPHHHASWDSYPWSAERVERYEAGFSEMRDAAAERGIDLRRGAEVFPSVVLETDPGQLVLEGTRAVLCEFPGSWLDFPDQLSLVERAASRIASAGLVPVLAHPERNAEVQRRPEALAPFAAQGWLLCANGPSFTGDHGDPSERTAWRLLELGLLHLVASDGHRAGRPPTLDQAWSALVAALGPDRAAPLFDGSRLPWV
ncbi:MAG: CpsB/CapC family capsule biosynthesis tyrosine phosphatase [Gaiellales bacterium]